MLECVEFVSRIVALYTELEVKLLIRDSVLTRQLSIELVKLYVSSLQLLAKSCHYFGQSTWSEYLRIPCLTGSKH